MDIHQLKVFASVFKSKSFSKASEELHLTQPTVSEHIKSLEKELNCKLFDRLGRKIIPTREAEALYNQAIELIDKLNSMKEMIGYLKKEATGELIIGASTIPGTYIMPSVIAEFKKKYPSILFQVLISDSKDIVQKILTHELFIGIVGAKLDNSQITYTPFLEDELVVVSSPKFTKYNQLTLKELIKLPFLMREEGSGTRKETEKILEEKGLDIENIKVAGIFGSTDAIKQAIKAGLGVSILSKISIKDELKYGIFKEIKLSDVQMKRNFYIVTHKKRTLPTAYNLFLEHLKV